MRALVSGDDIKKSLSGVKDKTMTDNTCLLYERIRWAFVLCICSRLSIVTANVGFHLVIA